jgi:hypothetical protein
MITHNIAFTPDTRAQLIAGGILNPHGSFAAQSQELPYGLWPAPGDLYQDDRLCDSMFTVVSRLFHWAKNGDLTYQLLLELSFGSLPAQKTSGTVLPFTKTS